MNRFEKKFETFTWIDFLEPKHEHLESLAKEFSLVDRIVLNAMDPEHLPKFEKIKDGIVLFLRVVDPKKKAHANNIQDLTTKITIILKDDKLITLHRIDQVFIKNLREDESLFKENRNNFLKMIIDNSIRTYDEPFNVLEARLEEFEEKVFSNQSTETIFQEGYILKRKASAYKKVMKFYSEMFIQMSSYSEYQWKDYMAEKEFTDRLLFYVDDSLENISSLLSLHLSVMGNKTNEASYKTNEVMRVLTVFSIFFLPLNFLAGLYGMNFRYMPELEHPMGYFGVLILMALISLFIFIWLLRRGWLNDAEKKDRK